jgi:tRNA-splicing ligase RtcB
MPDLHGAHGVAVGTVFATDGVLVLSALGGDLGCGVSAVQLDLPAQSLGWHELERVLDNWNRSIPAGDAVHRGRGRAGPASLVETPLSTGALELQRERLLSRHLGTLGGGNHFLELDRDMDGGTWLLVHSGSRGVGSAIGAHHVRAAEGLAHGGIPGLPIDSDPGRAFMADLAWALG